MKKFIVLNAQNNCVLGEFNTFCTLPLVWNLLVKIYDTGDGIFVKEVK